METHYLNDVPNYCVYRELISETIRAEGLGHFVDAFEERLKDIVM